MTIDEAIANVAAKQRAKNAAANALSTAKVDCEEASNALKAAEAQLQTVLERRIKDA